MTKVKSPLDLPEPVVTLKGIILLFFKLPLSYNQLAQKGSSKLSFPKKIILEIY